MLLSWWIYLDIPDMIFESRCIGAVGWRIIKPVVCLKVKESLLVQQKPFTLPPVGPGAVPPPT
jgi:hypothetical protein